MAQSSTAYNCWILIQRNHSFFSTSLARQRKRNSFGEKTYRIEVDGAKGISKKKTRAIFPDKRQHPIWLKRAFLAEPSKRKVLEERRDFPCSRVREPPNVNPFAFLDSCIPGLSRVWKGAWWQWNSLAWIAVGELLYPDGKQMFFTWVCFEIEVLQNYIIDVLSWNLFVWKYYGKKNSSDVYLCKKENDYSKDIVKLVEI